MDSAFSISFDDENASTPVIQLSDIPLTMELGDYEFFVYGQFTSDAVEIFTSYALTLTVTKSCQSAAFNPAPLTDSATVNYDSTASINASVLFSPDVAGCTITYSC